VINLNHRRRADHDGRRTRPPAAVYKPEVASLNMGSMNFAFFGMPESIQKVRATIGN